MKHLTAINRKAARMEEVTKDVVALQQGEFRKAQEDYRGAVDAFIDFQRGAQIFRVHNVKAAVQAVKVLWAVR